MFNNFSQLDAQSAESRFAQFTTEEHAEYQAWLDMVAERHIQAEFAPIEPADYGYPFEACYTPFQWLCVRVCRWFAHLTRACL